MLQEIGIVPPDTLYGLYQGTPLPEREWAQGNVLPDRITIYQQPIVEDSDDDDAIIRTIGETVIHEFGHYFGLSEERGSKKLSPDTGAVKPIRTTGSHETASPAAYRPPGSNGRIHSLQTRHGRTVMADETIVISGGTDGIGRVAAE